MKFMVLLFIVLLSTGSHGRCHCRGESEGSWIPGAILGGAVGLVAGPLVLPALGFGAGGIVGSSIAAGVQSSIGEIP